MSKFCCCLFRCNELLRFIAFGSVSTFADNAPLRFVSSQEDTRRHATKRRISIHCASCIGLDAVLNQQRDLLSELKFSAGGVPPCRASHSRPNREAITFQIGICVRRGDACVALFLRRVRSCTRLMQVIYSTDRFDCLIVYSRQPPKCPARLIRTHFAINKSPTDSKYAIIIYLQTTKPILLFQQGA